MVLDQAKRDDKASRQWLILSREGQRAKMMGRRTHPSGMTRALFLGLVHQATCDSSVSGERKGRRKVSVNGARDATRRVRTSAAPPMVSPVVSGEKMQKSSYELTVIRRESDV